MEEGHTGVSYVGIFGQMGCREGKRNTANKESVISLLPIEDMGYIPIWLSRLSNSSVDKAKGGQKNIVMDLTTEPKCGILCDRQLLRNV